MDWETYERLQKLKVMQYVIEKRTEPLSQFLGEPTEVDGKVIRCYTGIKLNIEQIEE